MKKILIALLSVVIIYFLFTLIVPTSVDKDKNPIVQTPPYQVSTNAQQIYDSLDFISDLHADSLLWKRNLLKKSDYGHVDIPRLREANMSRSSHRTCKPIFGLEVSGMSKT